ncbi:MAG TPA: cupin domain-containing protein [Pseudonocardiaceae bacterium]|jgi:mannose-6-phosphate isomerase-like protein (cupin superfamily)|nr:cupin domain-containing protein [Pseudonocardiaceae bacterium]
MVSDPPTFPGATAVSGLSVYPWEAADGLCGGSPHMHLTCTEAYVVVSGEGAVQTLTAGGLTETPLTAGAVVWFGPGTIHRAVNTDGALRAIVVMQNSGLPEAGDAVFTFAPEILADPDAYRKAAVLAEPSEESARARRDLAVAGFRQLADRMAAGDTGALERFYRAALACKRDRLDEWERIWRAGPVAATQRTGDQLAQLRDGKFEHLLRAEVGVAHPPAEADRRFGMCGRLDTYPLAPR